MAQGDPLVTHTFGVQLGGYNVEYLQEVSNLVVEQDVIEYRQVSQQGKLIVRKQPGARRPGEVTIKRGLDSSSAFTKWIKETLNKGAINSARQNLTIEVKNTETRTARRIQLTNAWVSRWEGPTFSAGDSGPATETVTIVFEEITVE
ncbi:phage tail protein [Kitasatospora sp. GAS204B]|uniref:phage tail protein n=1 Tax=unclassified Kitasatospora TaxID=2633591 RepID=UPI002475E71A|nr:phage tail protein [Kitasatospora sp. GAS204B]MDH6121436.1 phage tail-like protein [Kitasatospora sp. GAS204B]